MATEFDPSKLDLTVDRVGRNAYAITIRLKYNEEQLAEVEITSSDIENLLRKEEW